MDTQSFPRQARLHTKADFVSVFKQARKSTDGYFTVLCRDNHLLQARLGLAISRRCARSAVVRNRIKRLIRESFRHQQCALVGLDIVVIGKPALTDRANHELFASLTRHWQAVA